MSKEIAPLSEESKLDTTETLVEVWSILEHLKERILMRDDTDVTEILELQKLALKISSSDKYCPSEFM